MKRLLFAATLGLLLSCTSDTPQVAGGDDMGNFAQATLVDSFGSPLRGRVRVLADHDTFSLEVLEGGVIRIPSRSRTWIRVIGPGGECLLDRPADSGQLGTLTLGRPRPLLGWLARTGSLRIPGLGEAARQGGLFRFEAVPPGRMRLVAQSDSFFAELPFSVKFSPPRDTLVLPPDSLALPPLVVTGSSLAAASRSDTAACGAGCASWLWSRVNVAVPSDSSPSVDTASPIYTRLRLTPTPSPDSGLCDSIRVVADHGNTVVFRLVLRGRNVVPRLRGIDGGSLLLQAFRAGSVAPAARDSAYSLLAMLVRSDDSLLQDSLHAEADALGGSIDLPPVRSVAADTCTAILGGQSCRAPWGRYLLMEP